MIKRDRPITRKRKRLGGYTYKYEEQDNGRDTEQDNETEKANDNENEQEEANEKESDIEKITRHITGKIQTNDNYT